MIFQIVYHSLVFYFGFSAQIAGLTIFTGIETMEIADAPMTKATSISDFWGKRWNRNIGNLLRVSASHQKSEYP